MAIGLINKLKKVIDRWMLSDSLYSDFTNSNEVSNAFINSFGIQEICLIEMYDDKRDVYISPSVIGKCLLFKKEGVDGQFINELTEILNEKIEEGYGIQVFSHSYGVPKSSHEFLLSLSCNYEDNEEDFEELENNFKILYDCIEKIVEKINIVKPSYLINYIDDIIYAESNFLRLSSTIYSGKKLFREQLIKKPKKTEIVSNINSIEYINNKTKKSYNSVILGAKQYPILENINIINEKYDKILTMGNKGYSDNLKRINLITVAIFKPKKVKNDKPTVSEKMDGQTAIYSMICSYSDDIEQSDKNIEDVTNSMNTIEYFFQTFKNKQLGALSLFMPLQLNEVVMKEAETMRAVRRVDKINGSDLLPLFFCLNTIEKEG